MKVLLIGSVLVTSLMVSACSSIGAGISEMGGDITGNTYTIDTFDNYGNLTLQTHGEKINMTPNIIKEPVWTGDGWSYSKEMSSVVTINIDGNEMITCGDTCIFYEDGLTPEASFDVSDFTIGSQSDSILDNTLVSGALNKVKNAFGKSMVVVVKSQLGIPIYAFSGDKVNWEVSTKLPKTTRLSIDGHLMYIHRGTFQIIDKDLLK